MTKVLPMHFTAFLSYHRTNFSHDCGIYIYSFPELFPLENRKGEKKRTRLSTFAFMLYPRFAPNKRVDEQLRWIFIGPQKLLGRFLKDNMATATKVPADVIDQSNGRTRANSAPDVGFSPFHALSCSHSALCYNYLCKFAYFLSAPVLDEQAARRSFCQKLELPKSHTSSSLSNADVLRSSSPKNVCVGGYTSRGKQPLLKKVEKQTTVWRKWTGLAYCLFKPLPLLSE